MSIIAIALFLNYALSIFLPRGYTEKNKLAERLRQYLSDGFYGKDCDVFGVTKSIRWLCMTTYYLAIDIGASSGRHILGHVENGILKTEEIYRFPNELIQTNGSLCWDTNRLFAEIKTGLKKCREAGKIPVSLGIDTWGVDFVLLDKENRMLGNAVGYRDRRTAQMDALVYQQISEHELYARTGIQKQSYNTIYQLMAVKAKQPQLLANAETLLLMPDYFHFLLTGVKATEYTNATTTQLLQPSTGTWDFDLLHLLGYPSHLFAPIAEPGTILGSFTKEIQEEVGFSCQVVLPSTHDTASAIMAVPSTEQEVLYISSGTWSLMGVERNTADCSEQSRQLNFTNEGGYARRFCYLKSIMGLWMIQSLKKELNHRYSFAELCSMAENATISSIVDCFDECFLSPDSMMDAVRIACEESGQQTPETPAEFARVIYCSLADFYKKAVTELESITHTKYSQIHVIGGGSQADYLNRLTAEACHKKVVAGPAEATAIGNLLAQMITDGVFSDLTEARRCVFDSCSVQEYFCH